MYSESNPKQHTYKGDTVSSAMAHSWGKKNIRQRKLVHCSPFALMLKTCSVKHVDASSAFTPIYLKDFEPKVKLLCSQWSAEMEEIWQMMVCLTVASWVYLIGGRPVVRNCDMRECWGWWDLGHAASCLLPVAVKSHVMKKFSTVHGHW